MLRLFVLCGVMLLSSHALAARVTYARCIDAPDPPSCLAETASSRGGIEDEDLADAIMRH